MVVVFRKSQISIFIMSRDLIIILFTLPFKVRQVYVTHLIRDRIPDFADGDKIEFGEFRLLEK